ncbi:MAG: cyclomaltodextrinase N-terminal domain-containing protein, partial [Pyrinomonadaceae bacterium]
MRKVNPQSSAKAEPLAFLCVVLSSLCGSTFRSTRFWAPPPDVRWWLRPTVVILLFVGLCPGLGRSPAANLYSPEGRRPSAHQAAQPLQNSQSALPAVIKVEPPSWWARHTINPVRLLVRGRNLGGARVSSLNPAIRVSGVLANKKATYLFADVSISPAARPGEYPLRLATSNGSTAIPFRVNAPLDPRTHFQGITNDDVIYLIMPDRFANGDASNDAPAD